MCNKIHDFIPELQDSDTDIAVITETWLTAHKNTITAELKVAGYNIMHAFRDNKKGGGVAIVSKIGLNLSGAKTHNFTSFESVSATLPKKCNGDIKFIVLYRHGTIPNSLFLTEFHNFIELTQQTNTNFIFCGDFNLHVNNCSDKDANDFKQILSDFSLKQHVEGPTHLLGNTLDLIITNHTVNVSNINVDNSTKSDHALIKFSINVDAVTPAEKVINVRKCNNLNSFNGDISLKSVEFVTSAVGHNFNDAINMYKSMCANIVEHHAPARDITIPFNSQPKWMDTEFKNARRQRRSLYKKYVRSGKTVDKSIYQNCRNMVNDLSVLKRRQFYAKTIQDCTKSQKELYRVCDSLLDKEKATVLPQLANENPRELANTFNSYFTDKITKIRSNFVAVPYTPCESTTYQGPKFANFNLTNDEELSKVIHSKPIKASRNDHIPSFLLKTCLDKVITMFTFLVNLSLITASMDGLKDSIVTPLLKKAGLDPEDMANYRPVADLKYLHRLIERTVLPQLNSHMSTNHLHIPNQSGYRPYHSCETLLLRIVNDILVSMDGCMCTVLILLDLSAAFDTVDHDLLLDILYYEMGLRGAVFQWFVSYLRGRKQCVKIHDMMSDFADSHYGVPQGSVLGPVLFNIYVRSFITAVERAGFSIHGYADDHQILDTFRIEFQFNTLRVSIPRCLQLISGWMDKYFLKLNPTKSQVIVFSPRDGNSSVLIDHIIMSDNSFIRISDVVTNLGMRLDSKLSFSPQISSIVSGGYQLIKDIGKIRRYLSSSDLKTLINSFMISRIDTCNSLYYGISSYELNRLQMIQNSCARLIFGARKFEHVTPLFQDLHWLPIRARIVYKIICFVFKCLHDTAPVYLKSLLHIRNADNLTLYIPRRNCSIGDRAFSTCGPALWNALPLYIKQVPTFDRFKGQLKHHLFTNFDNFIQVLNRYRC